MLWQRGFEDGLSGRTPARMLMLRPGTIEVADAEYADGYMRGRDCRWTDTPISGKVDGREG
jgi:hypothetical protein